MPNSIHPDSKGMFVNKKHERLREIVLVRRGDSLW